MVHLKRYPVSIQFGSQFQNSYTCEAKWANSENSMLILNYYVPVWLMLKLYTCGYRTRFHLAFDCSHPPSCWSQNPPPLSPDKYISVNVGGALRPLKSWEIIRALDLLRCQAGESNLPKPCRRKQYSKNADIFQRWLHGACQNPPSVSSLPFLFHRVTQNTAVTFYQSQWPGVTV